MSESIKFNYSVVKKLETLNSKGPPEIFAEYRVSDPLVFSRTYNINLNDDGTVFDKDLKMRYDTLSEWMKSTKRSI